MQTSVVAQQEASLPDELRGLSVAVEAKPESFVTGSDDIQLAALQATKHLYDLALKSEAASRAHITQLLSTLVPTLAPETRSQAKKKHDAIEPLLPPQVSSWKDTPLTELYTEGMSDDQIWEQLELRTKNVCELLESVLEGDMDELPDDGDDEEGELDMYKTKAAMIEEGFDTEDMEGIEDFDDEDQEEDESEEGGEDEDEDEESDGEEEGAEAVEELRDPSEDEFDVEEPDSDLEKSTSLRAGKRSSKRKSKSGHSELDDGFFDLAAFNAETEEAEAKKVSRGRLGGDDSEEDEDEEDVDLFAPVDDAAVTGEDFEGDASEPFYRDFFDAPSRKKLTIKLPPKTTEKTPSGNKVRFHEQVRVKSIKAKGKGLPVSVMYEEDEEDEANSEDEEGMLEDDEFGEAIGSDDEGESDDMDDGENEIDGSIDAGEDEEMEGSEEDGREAIERLKDDIFADVDDEDKPDTDMSTYERRMATLQEEIAALETENVSKKDWVLMGEASSKSRPQNSLLEQDLDFERVMKSVPVITEEVVHSLEERIKTRILESNFDDVLRRRPVEDKPFLPSRFFELQDKKSKQSLAEIYEDEYTAAATGGTAGEDRDSKLKKEHEEIEKLWENVAGKLDALCNAHFTPKAPKAIITTVSNVAAATMESALPTTMSTSTMLAPEEGFAANPKDLRSRTELSPAEKRAQRNKQKRKNRKVHEVLQKTADNFSHSTRLGGVKRAKEDALRSVVKSGKGVTVVGKKNEDVLKKRKRKKAP